MRNRIAGLAAALGLTAAELAFAAAPFDALNPPVDVLEDVRNSYIFVFKDSVGPDQVPGLAAGLSKAAGGALGHVYRHTIKGFSAKLPAQAAAKLADNPAIAYYEADQVVFASKPPSKGPGGGDTSPPATTAQITPWGIARVGGACNGTGKTAWIIDTGIDLGNEDLVVDASRGYNATRERDVKDGNGHGTHVSGTVAAKNNGIDVVGVAAGATVVPVKVLAKSGFGSTSGVIAGVEHVASKGKAGDVANMSLGGGVSTSLDNAVLAAAAKDIKFSLAAGNESSDANNSSPARVNHENVYTVSAIGSGDVFAYFSNYGNPPVDFAAPGVSVESLKVGGGTVTYSGTSMAAPHVAGILLCGAIKSDGTVKSGDLDGTPDPIAHR